MSEPIVIRCTSTNLVVSTNDVTDATGLREIADWMDAQDDEYMVLSLNSLVTVDHSGRWLRESRELSAILEVIEHVSNNPKDDL